MNTNIDDTQITVFGILDGHGGEFAAVFAKEYLMEKLCKKIKQASDIATGKSTENQSSPKNDTEKQYEYETDKDGADSSPNTPKKGKLKKTMSVDVDCNRRGDCNQEQNKLNDLALAKDNFFKTNNQNARPIEYDANHYVGREKKIDFHRMITDLVLLTDYELILRAKRQVCKRCDCTTASTSSSTI